MKRVIIKCFWIWNFDKEEKWLNEMSAKGLKLVSVGFFRYVFEKGNPGEYTYRMELLDNSPYHVESQQYISFLQDTGAEYVGNVMRWTYFRKKTTEKAFALFSDFESRIRHLNRISMLILPFFILELVFGLKNLFVYLDHKSIGGNLWSSIYCLLFDALLGYGYLKIFFKKRQMKRDRILYE